ncbi:Phospholipid/glycerol acyltransferase [Penicillium sp. DV-2018c]|nr:Phospholipid/glycerol acyltransferase [Penicillium sp. DV-2018c]KAJ5583062.1 Phospholipid/glycerol acyltransferase [Penicillium sp. DV-2018c]
MDSSATAESPSLPWRALSNTTIWGVAGLCRAFLSTLSHAECHGKEAFTELLDSRRDVSKRTRGLITDRPIPNPSVLVVSNHISVYVSKFFRLRHPILRT